MHYLAHKFSTRVAVMVSNVVYILYHEQITNRIFIHKTYCLIIGDLLYIVRLFICTHIHTYVSFFFLNLNKLVTNIYIKI